jgi:hypothetical protein
MTRTCGTGLSCEMICPVKNLGQECTLSLLEFAGLFDAPRDVLPSADEVRVPVHVV